MRLLEAADPAAAVLAKKLGDPAKLRREDIDADTLRAAQIILDRAGHGPGQTVTLEGEVSLGERIRRGRKRAQSD
jgi:hypothetical protein